MIRLEELKAYQRTRTAGTDLSADDVPWLTALPAGALGDRLAMASDGEADRIE